MPRVSVIIPTYNRRQYVQEAIDSVLAQTHMDYEIIVIDDGSTDGTGKVLEARYGDRIRYEWQENQGESVARNRGIELACGEFVAFLDSDDLWLPDKLTQQLTLVSAHDDIGMVYGGAWLIDGSGHRISDDPWESYPEATAVPLADLLRGNTVSGPTTVLIRRSTLDRVGGFDPEIRYGEDWDLWIRVASTTRIWYAPEPLACIRRHTGTQCYYPDPQKNSRRLADNLRVLEKAFSACPEMLTVDEQRGIQGEVYIRAFLDEMAVGNLQNALQCLDTAKALLVQAAIDPAPVESAIVTRAATFGETAHPEDLSRGIRYAKDVVRRLIAVGIIDRASARRTIARANATLGFLAFARQGGRAARPYMVRVLIGDSSWRHNRGFVSVLAQSLLGKTVKEWLARILPNREL